MANCRIWTLLSAVLIYAHCIADTYGSAVKNDVKEVHIVFMNHLDVGYDGVSPKTGFINVVLNTYFTEHFPRALNLSRQLKEGKYEETFIYTTHPFLVWMYLLCPENFTLSGITLKCPTKEEKNAMAIALIEGTVSYHAGPMNMQLENMNQLLFEMSLNVSQDLDSILRLKRNYRVLSQRDVPGITKAVIPTLLKKDIAAISVGVNDGTSPPAVPKIFTWKFDDENEIIAMWHPGGYPDNPGPNPAKPEGLSIKDCVTVDNFDKALCFAFRTDNSGPPVNVEEILGYYEILRVEFPGAKLMASTFEKFVEAVQPIKHQLPVITNEIGDTWISGIASDPRKMAEYRAVTQTLTECVEKGECDPAVAPIPEAIVYLMKPGEHTWGLPSLMDTYNWSNTNFVKARSGQNYKNCEQAWLEQREFTYLAIKMLGNHPVVQKINDRLQTIKPDRPDLTEWVEVQPTTFQALDGMLISFGQDGTINKLYDPTNKMDWAANGNFGQFVYRTYDEGTFNSTNKLYSFKWKLFTKPFLTRYGNAVTKMWPTKVDKMYRWEGNQLMLWLKLVMVDPASYIMYGAPREVWIRYVYNVATPSSPAYFDVDLRWFDKTATRIPEMLMYYFSPSVTAGQTAALQKPVGVHDHKLRFQSLRHKDEEFTWKLRKLGELIDPSSVVLNGSQYQHAIDSDVRLTTPAGRGLRVVSLDVPLVSLSTQNVPASPFLVPLTPITQREITGFGFNIYNNMWDTNYIFYYPYKEGIGDENFRANFKIVFD